MIKTRTLRKASFNTICNRNGLQLTNRQLEQIERYVELLLDWNKKINLISRKDEENIWLKHILHCASLLFKLEFPKEAKVIDIGTGGGLPGIPLKILQPDLEVTLLDATQKRTNVVQNILRELSLSSVTVLWGRAEEAGKRPELKGYFDISIARAVAPLKKLVNWSRPLLKPGSGKARIEIAQEVEGKIRIAPPALIAMKGGQLQDEVEAIHRLRKTREIRTIDLVYTEQDPAMLDDKKVVCVFF